LFNLVATRGWCHVVEAYGNVGMLGTERLLPDREGTLQERLGLCLATLLVKGDGLLIERCCLREWVVCIECRALDRDRERHQDRPKERSDPRQIHPFPRRLAP
jgi:hypothetical protein